MSAQSLVAKYIISLLLLVVICVCVYVAIESFFQRIIVENEKVVLKKLASSDIIYFKNIAGFKRGKEGEMEIIHTDPTHDPIRIPTGLENQEKFHQWLSENFKNLDPRTEELEREELLKNPALGHTQQVREDRLKEINTLTKYLNWASVAVTFWVLLPIQAQASRLCHF